MKQQTELKIAKLYFAFIEVENGELNVCDSKTANVYRELTDHQLRIGAIALTEDMGYDVEIIGQPAHIERYLVNCYDVGEDELEEYREHFKPFNKAS